VVAEGEFVLWAKYLLNLLRILSCGIFPENLRAFFESVDERVSEFMVFPDGIDVGNDFWILFENLSETSRVSYLF